jgi:pseudouridylate synthase
MRSRWRLRYASSVANPEIPVLGPSTARERPAVSAEVERAVADGRPVVALESTLITHGFPRPRNLEVARLAEAAVRACGAVPATVAVLDGRLRVGLDDAALEALSLHDGAAKASRQNLAAVLSVGAVASTTVSATMIAARLAGIIVFATGGIGGVHRGALGDPVAAKGPDGHDGVPDGHDVVRNRVGRATFDISADLDELARTPVLVVCSGPKSILDVSLTMEYLETHGVPVVGYGTDELPGFWCVETGIRVPIRADSPGDVASLVRRHWGLGLETGIVLVVPVPTSAAVPRKEADVAIAEALAAAADAAVHGPASTPWLLRWIGERTGGRTIAANVALIVHNAEVAALVAVALARGSLAAAEAGPS